MRLLKELNWLQCFGCVLVVLVIGKLAFWNSPLLPFRWILGGLFLMFKYYADWPDTVVRLHSVKSKSLLQKTLQTLPPIFPAMIYMNNAACASFYQWIKRKTLDTPQLAGEKIQFNQKSQYGTVLILFFLACAIDIPISALMVGLFGHDSGQNLRIHLAIFFTTIYAIIFVLGDRWAIKASCHVLDSDTLYLRLAYRFRADLPLSMIKNIEVIDEPLRIWCTKNRVSFYEKITVSPIDSPNILLTLKADAKIMGESFKSPRKIPQYVFLYVDDPSHLLLKVNSKWLEISRQMS